MSAVRRPVCVVLDGPPTPAWQARALELLRESSSLHVRAVTLIEAPPRRAIARRHAAYERRLLRLGRDPLQTQSVAPLSAGEAGGSDQLLIWLSERPPDDHEDRALLQLRHARRSEPAERAVRRATLGGESSIESEVVLRGADGRTTLVEQTVSELRRFSVTLSLDLMLWKLAALVPRAAARAPGLDRPAPPAEPASSAPSTAALLASSALAWPRILGVHALFRRPWSIRVRRREPRADAGWPTRHELVRWARGHLYADPFLFEHEGRHHLFCEEVPPGQQRAFISHTELSRDGSPARAPQPVLVRPYHLSYPFVVAHRGELLMIPETSAVKRVELYRAVDFPTSWERDAVLLEGVEAADATLLAHDGRLWMFAAIAAENASSLDELHVFWADSPRGPWQAHPLNPVVSDARCARPAGAVLRCGERLVRPGQDCSRRYGGSISFREIDVLSTERYAEHEIARLDAADVAHARATHTYTADASFEAIDFRHRELRLALAARSLRGALRGHRSRAAEEAGR